MEYIVNVSTMEVADVSKEIVAFFTYVRLSQGLTCRATDKIVAGAASMVYRVERQSRNMTISTLFELCNLYGLTLVIKTPNVTFGKIIATQGDDRLQQFGDFVRRYRVISRVQLSQDTGVNYNTLSNIEAGSTAVKLTNFLLIAKALNWQIKIKENTITES